MREVKVTVVRLHLHSIFFYIQNSVWFESITLRMLEEHRVYLRVRDVDGKHAFSDVAPHLRNPWLFASSFNHGGCCCCCTLFLNALLFACCGVCGVAVGDGCVRGADDATWRGLGRGRAHCQPEGFIEQYVAGTAEQPAYPPHGALGCGGCSRLCCLKKPVSPASPASLLTRN